MVVSERRYRDFLDSRAGEGLRRELRAVAAHEARTIHSGDRSYINFSSNDYLGLRFNKTLIDRAKAWADAWGVGSGASRLVTGNLDPGASR
jgi:8-amino-7-oxononanoate synthase